MSQLTFRRFMVACAMAWAFTSIASAQYFTIAGTTTEVIGDPGGTSLANPFNSTAGQGLPTNLGGWAVGPGFAPDPTFGNALGISGYKNDAATLTVNLNTAMTVRFTWVGKGDSVLQNSFQVNTGSGFQTLWGPAGTPVAYPPASTVFYDLSLPAGAIAFRWVTGNNFVVNNGSSDLLSQNPGFFAAVDPYLATGTFQTSSDVVYLGLTDLPGAGDHDFQDLGVRLSAVPEPASILLLSAAGVGFVGYQVVRRRRRSRSPAPAKA